MFGKCSNAENLRAMKIAIDTYLDMKIYEADWEEQK